MVKVRFNDQPIQIRVQGAALVTHQSALAQAAADTAASAASQALFDAQLAELAALTAPEVYIDVATGLGAAPEGGTFWVKTDDGLALYRKVGGLGVLLDVIGTTVDVTKYGADPTGVADSSAAVQLATDYVAGRGGGVVFFPPGTFTLEGVTLKEGVRYLGLSWRTTKLRLPAAPSAPMFSAATAATFAMGGFDHLELDGGQDEETATFDAIDFSAIDMLEEFHIESCYIHHFRRGYNGSLGSGLGNDRFPVLRNSRFWNNHTGIFTNEHAMLYAVDCRSNVCGLDGRINDLICALGKFNNNRVGVGLTGLVTNSYFSTCTFYKNVDISLVLDGNSTVDNSMFVGANDPTAQGGAGETGILVRGNSVAIIGNRFGQHPTTACYSGEAIKLLVEGSAQALLGLQVKDNDFRLFGAGIGIRSALGTNALSGAQIVDNSVRSAGKRFAVLDLISCCQISDNSMQLANADNAVVPLPSGEAMIEWGSLAPMNQIHGNVIWAIASMATGHAIKGPIVATDLLSVRNNAFRNFTGEGPVSVTGGNMARWFGNVGYATEASGDITVAEGATSATVSHGLARAPARRDFYVSPINAGAAGVNWYISAASATQLTITLTSPAPSGGAQFGWQAGVF